MCSAMHFDDTECVLQCTLMIQNVFCNALWLQTCKRALAVRERKEREGEASEAIATQLCFFFPNVSTIECMSVHV